MPEYVPDYPQLVFPILDWHDFEPCRPKASDGREVFLFEIVGGFSLGDSDPAARVVGGEARQHVEVDAVNRNRYPLDRSLLQ